MSGTGADLPWSWLCLSLRSLTCTGPLKVPGRGPKQIFTFVPKFLIIISSWFFHKKGPKNCKSFRPDKTWTNPLIRNMISSGCSKKKNQFPPRSKHTASPLPARGNAVYRSNRCVLRESQETHTYSVRGQSAEFVTNQAGAVWNFWHVS